MANHNHSFNTKENPLKGMSFLGVILLYLGIARVKGPPKKDGGLQLEYDAHVKNSIAGGHSRITDPVEAMKDRNEWISREKAKNLGGTSEKTIAGVIIFFMILSVSTFLWIHFDALSFLPTMNLKSLVLGCCLWFLFQIGVSSGVLEKFYPLAREKGGGPLLNVFEYLAAVANYLFIILAGLLLSILLIFRAPLMEAGFTTGEYTKEIKKAFPEAMKDHENIYEHDDRVFETSSNPLTNNTRATLPYGKICSWILLIFAFMSLLISFKQEHLFNGLLSCFGISCMLIIGDLRIMNLFGLNGKELFFIILGIVILVLVLRKLLRPNHGMPEWKPREHCSLPDKVVKENKTGGIAEMQEGAYIAPPKEPAPLIRRPRIRDVD